MDKNKSNGYGFCRSEAKFIHYHAAKRVVQKALGEELAVSDKEFDRWLLDGEIKARDGVWSNAVSSNYRYMRYGSLLAPPIHDPRTFVLLDALCSRFYSEEELERFKPSTRWIDMGQWIERWTSFGYAREEVVSLINGCCRRARAKDIEEPAYSIFMSLLSPYAVALVKVDPEWAWTWASPPIYRSSHIQLCDINTGEHVYLITKLPLHLGAFGGARVAIFEDGIYRLDDGDLVSVLSKSASELYYCVGGQWHGKIRTQDGEEFIEEPCEDPRKPLREVVKFELFSMEKIKELEGEYFPDAMSRYEEGAANVSTDYVIAKLESAGVTVEPRKLPERIVAILEVLQSKGISTDDIPDNTKYDILPDLQKWEHLGFTRDVMEKTWEKASKAGLLTSRNKYRARKGS